MILKVYLKQRNSLKISWKQIFSKAFWAQNFEPALENV